MLGELVHLRVALEIIRKGFILKESRTDRQLAGQFQQAQIITFGNDELDEVPCLARVLARLEDDNTLRVGELLEIGRTEAFKVADAVRPSEFRCHASIEKNIALKGLARGVTSGKALV